ncbi:hypothetical protein WJX75_007021 [Coccomyxa subellipsoidea]|uniref:Protein kinase domain-containing protein n=1 Tax=Coccomyxa subellipsoidea TaxID=248742 RepID=A0ABR2YGP8_9CHLO
MSSRIDVWDQKKHREHTPVSCGYPAGFEEKYELGDELGRGGFGVVRVVSKKKNGKQYAAKSIKKVLEVPNLSIDRQAAHLANIKREISVLYRLRGTLNIVHFKEALEDDEYVHIVMEICRGGELSHSLAKRHYSEKTVSSYMRAVLRTLAQCHSHRILHRDVKPGNFMLLNTSDRSPLKAIDFGLAVFYDANKLPRTDLGLEGTPWFLAPENLSSEFYPASDIWSAGVMAYQLLSGYLPFDDRRNRNNPALSQVWKAILTEEPNFNNSAFKDVSEDAKSFISMLLNKDHRLRPSAKDALNHPWLAGGNSADRAKGAPLQQTVVQRIQRFNQGSALKRTIFELIAQELLLTLVPDPSLHGAAPASMDIDWDKQEVLVSHKRPLDDTRARDGSKLAFQGPGGGAIEGPPLLGRVSAGSAHGGLEYYRVRGESVHGAANAMLHDRHGKSVHGGGNYWRILRAAATAAKWHNHYPPVKMWLTLYVLSKTSLHCREAEAVTEAELAQGLASLGFRLEASEARALVEKMDEHRSGAVRKSAFVASQLDWPAIQTDYREQWLAAARKVFEGFDGANGLTIQRLMTVLREKLPAAEVDYAVEDALVDAGYKDEEEIDFEGFIRILRAGSADSLDNLDQYDPRLSNHLSPRAELTRDDSEHSEP